MRGLLFVVSGPMFAGKTSVVVDAMQSKMFNWDKLKIPCKHPLGFCNRLDSQRRGIKPAITSHNSVKITSCVEWLDDDNLMDELIDNFNSIVSEKIDWIFIDEVQFFDKSGRIRELVEKILSEGINICLTGLSQDSFGEPFGLMGDFMAIADYVKVLQARCTLCDKPATKTQRISMETGQILVDAGNSFAPHCKDCWTSSPVKKIK